MSYRRDRARSRGVGAVDAADGAARHYPGSPYRGMGAADPLRDGAITRSYSRDRELAELTRGMSGNEVALIESGRMRPVIAGRASLARYALAGISTGKGSKGKKPTSNKPSSPTTTTSTAPPGETILQRAARIANERRRAAQTGTTSTTPTDNPLPTTGGSMPLPPLGSPARSRVVTPYDPNAPVRTRVPVVVATVPGTTPTTTPVTHSTGGGGGGGGGSPAPATPGPDPAPIAPLEEPGIFSLPDMSVGGFKITPTVLIAGGGVAVLGLFLFLRSRRH